MASVQSNLCQAGWWKVLVFSMVWSVVEVPSLPTLGPWPRKIWNYEMISMHKEENKRVQNWKTQKIKKKKKNNFSTISNCVC
jgi:hypothetical protein